MNNTVFFTTMLTSNEIATNQLMKKYIEEMENPFW